VAVAVRARFEQAGTKYLMFGETLADPWTINQYISPVMLDSQMDAPLFQAVPGPVFATDSMGLQTVKSETDNAMNNFGDKPMVRFIDSQDQPRFITKADPANAGKQGNKWDYLPSQTTDQRAYDRLYSALLNLMTLPGVPLIYYGDEYGEFGASDPDNRHMLLPEASLNSQQQAQLARTRKLLSTRSSLRGLGKGKLVQMWCNNNAWGTSGGDLMAYARLDATDPKQSAIVVLNLEYDPWDATTHWGQVVVNFPAEASWTSGTVVDALTDREYAFSNSSVTVDVPARGGVILRLK
jgi:hypothetical protein